MFKRMAAAIYLRRVARDLSRVAAALDRQTDVLARLADHFAPPALVPPDRKTLNADTAVSFLDPIEAGLALDFVAKITTATGHSPDDEEILTYLADEKTTDLQKRLAERELELTRLMEARR